MSPKFTIETWKEIPEFPIVLCGSRIMEEVAGKQ